MPGLRHKAVIERVPELRHECYSEAHQALRRNVVLMVSNLALYYEVFVLDLDWREDEQSQFISSACFRGSYFLSFSVLKRLF